MFGLGTGLQSIIGYGTGGSGGQLGMQQAQAYTPDPTYQILSALRLIPKEKRQELVNECLKGLEEEELIYDLEKQFRELSIEDKVKVLSYV